MCDRSTAPSVSAISRLLRGRDGEDDRKHNINLNGELLFLIKIKIKKIEVSIRMKIVKQNTECDDSIFNL